MKTILPAILLSMPFLFAACGGGDSESAPQPDVQAAASGDSTSGSGDSVPASGMMDAAREGADESSGTMKSSMDSTLNGIGQKARELTAKYQSQAEGLLAQVSELSGITSKEDLLEKGRELLVRYEDQLSMLKGRIDEMGLDTSTISNVVSEASSRWEEAKALLNQARNADGSVNWTQVAGELQNRFRSLNEVLGRLNQLIADAS